LIGDEKTWDFDEYADEYEDWLASDDPIYARYDEVLDRVTDLAGAGPGKTILDIGTGTGNLARKCLERGAAVVGLDPSGRMLAKARDRLGGFSEESLKQVARPFENLDYPEGSFDAVVSTYAFHHVHWSKQPACIREMVRVLRSGGMWVLGDLIFEHRAAEQQFLAEVNWLDEEYYPRIVDLGPVVDDLGMKLHSEQFTPITWVLWAQSL
jgi:putative AdoMet-dependent methyltransferase